MRAITGLGLKELRGFGAAALLLNHGIIESASGSRVKSFVFSGRGFGMQRVGCQFGIAENRISVCNCNDEDLCEVRVLLG